EAALALSDAGAKVTISYRGKGFNRAAPKNKQAVEAAAAQGQIKAKLGSQVINFEPDSVTLALADGSQKKYPNDAGFVLIGADPPVAWLEKVGVRFVERPHQYQLGKTDDLVRRYVDRAVECPEDAARAAAQVLGGSIGIDPRLAPPMVPPQQVGASGALPMPMGEPVSGPRKWLRSATSIFSSRQLSGVMPMPTPPVPMESSGNTSPGIAPLRADSKPGRSKKLDGPVPLSEFAKRGKTSDRSHSGHGRRDALSAGERTRILRMLRDEGGRLADEDEDLYIGGAPAAAPPAPPAFDFDFDEAPPIGPPVTSLRPDVPARPAVVVGIAQAQAARTNQRARHPKPSHPPPLSPQQAMPPAPPPPSTRQHLPLGPTPEHLNAPMTLPPTGEQPVLPPRGRSRAMAAVAAPPPSSQSRRPVPAPFGDEPTRQVDDQLLSALRNAPPAKRQDPAPQPARASATSPKPALPKPGVHSARPDEETRISIDTNALAPSASGFENDEMTRPSDDLHHKFLANAPATDPHGFTGFEDHGDEATRLSSYDGLSALERARAQGNDERTRAVNIRNDSSISDVDWDLD
ncbi:MAG TPA: hypothetical protein VGC42_09230, partial [Kofleriaceae bacterium]